MGNLKNKKLLKSYRGVACVLCGDPSSTAAHIQSKGAGGTDEEWNLLALCFLHHRQQHDKSWKWMVETYPELNRILYDKNWHVVEEFGRWRLKRI